MSSYSLNGTCSYNEQPVTVHIKGQTGDPSPPPKLSTCTNEAWSVNHLDLSDLSDGNVTIEVTHLSPNGKGYSVKKVVKKTSEGAAVSINRNNLSNITQGVANAYTLTGTCTEVNEDVTVEVSDGPHTETPSPQPFCQAASPVGEWSTSFDHSSLSEGTLTITVTHTSSTISDTVELIKDVTPPSVTIANTGGERVSTETYSLNGTCSEIDSDVGVTLTDSSPREITTTASCTNNSGNGQSGSGQWEVVNLDISSLADGDISISATQDDDVGNTGEATLTITKGPAVVGPIDPVVTTGCAPTSFVDSDDGSEEGSGGTGTFGDPYIVCNAVLLNKIRENTTAGTVFYKLKQDIDLGGAVFEPLGTAGAECLETGAFSYYFIGDGKRIVNYKVPMSRQDYYHPTDRKQDIFGRCITDVDTLTVNPGSSGTIEFCDLFDYGSSGGDVGLSLAEEQADGSFTMGPRILCSLDQLSAIANDVNNLDKDYILYKDMNFENVVYANPIIDGDYSGTFDGNNKTIRNLNISSSSLHVGFFKRIQQGGTVKDLKFENVNIKSTNESITEGGNSTHNYNPSRLGVLAAEVREGSVINCSVTDSDTDIDVLFENSSSSAVVVGGLIGYGLGLDIEDSFSEGLHIKVISSKAMQKLDVGGLVGQQGPCLHRSVSAVDCSIGSTSNTIGKIERSYTTYQKIRLNVTANNYFTSVGGLIGRMGSDEDSTFQIKDSYSWENSLVSSNLNDTNFGGLVGEYGPIFFGNGNNVYEISEGNLTIINSYAFGGNVSLKKGRLGGLLGYQNTRNTSDVDSLTIKNSFSNTPFTNLVERSDSTNDRSNIGGLYGSGGYSWNAVRNFSEAYYIGQIYCGPGLRLDACGGIGGAAVSTSGGSFDASTFSMNNIYSTAKIQQVTGSPVRIDHIGLLFSGARPLFQSNAPAGSPVLSAFGVATDIADNPSLYFLRNGITVKDGSLPGDTGSLYDTLKSYDQPCIALLGNDGGDACLGLAVDPEDSITAGNRSLTPSQFQSVPSNSTAATGTSPALGNEFLYTASWCPRVCRDGSTSCTETSNTLVGFDENGNPLPGPGGGLKAQARNEGRNCFEPCFEFEGNSSGVVSNTIKAYRCEVRDVEIPENTTSILADAFKDKNITSITFPESLVSIGNNAFSGNDLEDIIIPSGITSIGDNAFSNNSSLTTVCIETQASSIALGTTPFGTFASSSIDYQSDGDCSN